jgi:hypothetical protein
MRHISLILAAFTLAFTMAGPAPAGDEPVAGRDAGNGLTWYTLTNVPGVQGLGHLNPNGYVVEISAYRLLSTGAAITEHQASAYVPGRGVAPLTSPPVPSKATPQSSVDPYGFVCWINGVRARSGLHPVAWDESLVPAAAANSAAGFGHWPGTNSGFQNVGAGGSLATIEAAWMASPAHAAAILAPGMTRVALACVNGVFTMNGR